jgi:Na+/serine symporter
MAMGIPIVFRQALALSTTESSNLVIGTYDYIGAGKIRVFAKGSDANVRVNVFIDGKMVLRNQQVFVGTAGTMDNSANLVAEIPTAGGRVEVTAVATTGTPTLDIQVTHETAFGGNALARLLGRR